MNRSVTTLVALLLLAITGGASAQNTRPVDSIVAVVEEDVILRSELDRAVDRVLRQFTSSSRGLPPRDVLEKQVLDQLIMIELQIQRARDTGIRVSEEDIDRGIDRVAAQAGMTTEQMRRTVAGEGMDWAEFRSEMRDEILATRLRQRVASSRANVTETEIDLYLAGENVDSTEYHLGHILIGIPEGANPTQVQAARERAEQVRAEIEGGMDFATAAISYSDGQQALEGGDLGWRSSDQVPSMFAQMIRDMEPGQVSPPIRSASGFHMLKVMERREQAPKMVEEYSARHLLIEVNELVSSAEALDIISNLHERLEAGEDFAELARQYSDDPSSANLGGDMGWFQPDAFGPRVRQALTTMDDGEISQPFQTDIGWHVLQKIGERRQDRTDEYLRNQARESLRQQKGQEEIELFLRQMRDEAYVEYRI